MLRDQRPEANPEVREQKPEVRILKQEVCD